MKKILLTLILIIILSLSTNAQKIYTFAGNGGYGYTGDSGPATAARLSRPVGADVDAAGNMYICDPFAYVIRKVNTAGIISTFSGNNNLGPGGAGDGGQASDAWLSYPARVAFDAIGNLYIADVGNGIRMVNSAGIISTFAGNGNSYGDGGPATAAKLHSPNDIVFDAAGNLYIADATDNVVRKINTAGIISTVVGTPGSAGYVGDGGPATAAQLNLPMAIAIDAAGNLFIADDHNSAIRMVNTTGIISTYAGTGVAGYNGDGIAATTAQIYNPNGLAFDVAGNLYFNDGNNYRIRKINTAGIISTYAGNGTLGYSGDGGLATAAQIKSNDNPSHMSFDAHGNLFIPDFLSYVIRKIVPIGAALNFDGVDDYVDIGNGLDAIIQNSNKFMVEAWVKPSTTNNNGVIIGNFNTGTPTMQFLLRRDGANYTFWLDADSSFKTITSIATATVDVWQHVAGVWDGSTIKIFINGVLDNTVTGAIGSGVAPGANSVWIGGDGPSEYFEGSIDEVRVWNRVMCQAEIQHYMTAELPNSTSNLLAYYKFNQGYDNSDNTAISTLADSSGNAFNGTLNNFTLIGTTSNFVSPGAVISGSLVTAYSSQFATVATQTNVTCYGLANGIANIAATSDDPVITYNWSSGGTTATKTGLAPATYTCTTTSCGISAVQTFTITQPPQLVASSTSGTIACNGGATTVTVSAIGGTGALSGTGTFTNVAANSYTYTVTDANACTATTTITINEPTQLVLTATTGTIACNGGATTLTVSATGGTGAYIGNAGTYTVTANSYTYNVTDANNCAATTTITVAQPTQLMLTATAGTIACNGGATTVTVSATGGTPAYTGNAGTYTVTANSYTYSVTDANNCAATITITVTQPNPINVSVTVNSPTLTANNATATSYQWMDCNPPNPIIPGATHQSYVAIANGNYEVVITQGSCTATSTCTIISNIGIEQYNTTNNLQVYPNPFSNELTIVSTAKTNVMLFDILGNKINEFVLQNTTQTISLGDLAPGMYYLQVDTQKIKIIKL